MAKLPAIAESVENAIRQRGIGDLVGVVLHDGKVVVYVGSPTSKAELEALLEGMDIVVFESLDLSM